MKKILLFITASICTYILSAQLTYKIKADSVLITNDSCSAELIIENSTKNVSGFLYNKGKGRTEFRAASNIGDFILNQTSSDQSASFRVSGSGQVGTSFRLGNLSSNPTGSSGMIYYNSLLAKYRGFKSSAWVDFLTSDDIVGENGVSLFYEPTFFNKWFFRLGEACYGCGNITNGASKLSYNTYLPMNGYTLTFLKGDNTAGDMSNYTHITSNRGITLGNSQNIPTGSLLRIGSFEATGAKANWYSPETSNTTPNELVHIYSNPVAYSGNNGSEMRGLLIDLDMGSASHPANYANKKPIGADIYLRSNSNYNQYDVGDWIGLRLKTVSWKPDIMSRSKMYTLWADSGRVYFSDSVMIGTTNPRAKFTHNGTVSFNLGSDNTGDIFYRDSSGFFKRLSIGTNGQVLTVSSGLPAWASSGGGGSSPGGSNGQIQFNNSGSFGGSSNLYWDNSNNRLGIATSSPQYNLDVNGNAKISDLPFINHRDTVLSYDPSTKQLKATNIYARVMLTSDVTNNNGTANTLQDVTNLSFPVTSGVTYKFKFYIVYTAAATTTGSRWAINGPSTTFLHYTSEYSLSTTSTTTNQGVSAYNSPSAANNSSAATNSNVAVIEGIIKPSANGTVIARFASEVASSAIIAKGGMCYVEYEIIN